MRRPVKKEGPQLIIDWDNREIMTLILFCLVFPVAVSVVSGNELKPQSVTVEVFPNKLHVHWQTGKTPPLLTFIILENLSGFRVTYDMKTNDTDFVIKCLEPITFYMVHVCTSVSENRALDDNCTSANATTAEELFTTTVKHAQTSHVKTEASTMHSKTTYVAIKTSSFQPLGVKSSDAKPTSMTTTGSPISDKVTETYAKTSSDEEEFIMGLLKHAKFVVFGICVGFVGCVIITVLLCCCCCKIRSCNCCRGKYRMTDRNVDTSASRAPPPNTVVEAKPKLPSDISCEPKVQDTKFQTSTLGPTVPAGNNQFRYATLQPSRPSAFFSVIAPSVSATCLSPCPEQEGDSWQAHLTNGNDPLIYQNVALNEYPKHSSVHC